MPIASATADNVAHLTGILTSGPFNEPESDYTPDGESPTQYTQVIPFCKAAWTHLRWLAQALGLGVSCLHGFS